MATNPEIERSLNMLSASAVASFVSNQMTYLEAAGVDKNVVLQSIFDTIDNHYPEMKADFIFSIEQISVMGRK